ncbi:MAG: hypothetical protein JNM99_20405 [Verrucomicrobiaceae bacterium]|nr:hypothetical protein [Verrucomicrobiaceae bacterium]
MLRHLALRVIVLMLFVVSQTPVLPAAAALAVWIDGSHKVEFTAGSDGLTLMLRHQRKLGQNDTALPQGHQHGLLTRAVLTFAQSQGGTHPDHKLSFKNATDRYERSSVIESAGSKHAPQPLPFTWVDTRLDLARTHTTLVHASSRDEVIASPGLIGLCTVQMLI